jgi:hypothetical protein
MAAIHVLASIPQMNTVSAMARHLRLDPSFVGRQVDELVGLGILRFKGEKIQVLQNDIHVPGDSPQVFQHHGNWRQYIQLHQAEDYQKNVHFTALMAIGRDDADQIRKMVLDFLTQVRKVAESSPEEELVLFALDLMKL